MQPSAENITKIQLQRRFCRVVHLLLLFTNCVQSKNKGNSGRITSMLSILFLFLSFSTHCLDITSKVTSIIHLWQIHGWMALCWELLHFHQIALSGMREMITISHDILKLSKITQFHPLLFTELSKIQLFGRFGVANSELCYGGFYRRIPCIQIIYNVSDLNWGIPRSYI